MASQSHQIHFVLFPLMAPGHMNPVMDIARLLAQRGVIITIITTPHNATRFKTLVARSVESGLQIHLIQLEFPSEVGLPKGCENFDMLPSLGLAVDFFTAASLLQQPVEKLFEKLTPRPRCIISDVCLPYTANVATKFHIPRISFSGTSCVCLLCILNFHTSKLPETISSESEYFVVPGVPDHIEVTKAQILGPIAPTPYWKQFNEQMAAAEMASYGTIMNTFEALEPAYIKGYKKTRMDKVWCVGPVSLCNEIDLDKAQRGKNASIDEYQCLKWLDSKEPSSVLYACLGSMCNLIPSQLIELGLALEESKRAFIWVIKEGLMEKWIAEEGFEERIKGRGLIIRGWAPQVLILSHPAIGGFLTHCGWNSTLEGICAGIPMVTWPLFADQFLNEKLVVQVQKIGVSIGVEDPVQWGEEEKIGVYVKKEDVRMAIDMLMDEGEEREARQKRATELSQMAKKALEEGGSSDLDIKLLIQDILKQANDEIPN
uniref:Glycosyltransferase n=1 Tax=Fagus sylvatica TaxID=28930 RepID=A0A2N9GNP8_FAGSY